MTGPGPKWIDDYVEEIKPSHFLNAWWKDGIQHTRWMCPRCGKQYHTITEAENCQRSQQKQLKGRDIMYRYKLYSTGHSSSRFGLCEICKKHVSEVFHQVEERQYTFEGVSKWTRFNCNSLYGHKDCLVAERRI